MTETQPSHGLLACAQCGVVSDEQARGWWALPVSDDDELPTREDHVGLFCPECAASSTASETQYVRAKRGGIPVCWPPPRLLTCLQRVI